MGSNKGMISIMAVLITLVILVLLWEYGQLFNNVAGIKSDDEASPTPAASASPGS